MLLLFVRIVMVVISGIIGYFTLSVAFDLYASDLSVATKIVVGIISCVQLSSLSFAFFSSGISDLEE